MNCRTCQHELSEHLDGRLASGRRAQVLDHLAECLHCARAWRDLQRSQGLAQNLPRPRTGPDFRERLFARIEAGEGTPQAVFREPIPLLAKVRYTLGGALSAAALVVVAALLRDGAPTESHPAATSAPSTPAVVTAIVAPSPGSSAGDRSMPAPIPGGSFPAMLADVRTEPDYVASADAAPLAPRGQQTFLGAVKPLTPDLLAVETARQFEQRHQWTTRRLAMLDRSALDEHVAARIRDDAQSLTRLGTVLTDLRDARCLTFADPEVDADLRVFLSLLDDDRLGQHVPLVQLVREVVEPAVRKSPNLGRITSSISVTPAMDRLAQDEHVLRITRSWPELIDQLFFVLPDGAEAIQFDPLQLSRTFRVRTECGTVFVAPMSEIEGPKAAFRSLRIRVDGSAAGR